MRNTMLVVLGALTLGAGALAYSQFRERKHVESELEKQVTAAKESEQVFTAIEKNMTEMNARQGIVSNLTGKELTSGVRDRIFRELDAMEKVMARNRSMINDLENTVGAKDEKIAKFKTTMAGLDKRIRDYKGRIESLTQESDNLKKDLQSAQEASVALTTDLQNAKTEIESKSRTIASQGEELDKRERAMRTAYYTVGTYKELHDARVVDREGGFLGMASAKKLKTDFNKERFTRIDILSYTEIPVFSKEAQLVTNHPSESYQLVRGSDGSVQWIKITDPMKFWESSKYLVVITRSPQAPSTVRLNGRETP